MTGTEHEIRTVATVATLTVVGDAGTDTVQGADAQGADAQGADVHWHGVRVPNDEDGVAPLTQDLLQAGETSTHRFTAAEPAIGRHHPHHHGQEKLLNGMFGACIIGQVGEDIPFPSGQIGGREDPGHRRGTGTGGCRRGTGTGGCRRGTGTGGTGGVGKIRPTCGADLPQCAERLVTLCRDGAPTAPDMTPGELGQPS